VTARLSSGVARLDDVLGGGIPADAITLIAGEPGPGKTILAHHFVFHNATPTRPVLYCSTVSEPLDKLLRYGQALQFFDPTIVGTSVVEDLGHLAAGTDGLGGVLTRLDRLLQELRPAVIVIDSFKALRTFATDSVDHHRFLHSLAGRVSARAMSTFLLGEFTLAEDVANAPEFAVADVVVVLTSERVCYRTTRYLEVRKMRGGGCLRGSHAYRISERGLEVFPRIADPLDSSAYDERDGRVSTGIGALDALLGDGYWPGASTLVAGPTGSGKTLLGLHFLYRGAEQGETGVLATLQDRRPNWPGSSAASVGRSMRPAFTSTADRPSVSSSMNGSMGCSISCTAPAPGGWWLIPSGTSGWPPATSSGSGSISIRWCSAALVFRSASS